MGDLEHEPATALIADCPWLFDDPLPGAKRGASSHYACLSVPELCRFRLPELAPDCLLFFWRVGSMVPEAHAVIRAWGFSLTGAELVWVKTTTTSGGAVAIRDPLVEEDDFRAKVGSVQARRGERSVEDLLGKLHFGMGRTLRAAHEVCIVARRGRPKVNGADVRSVFFAPLPTGDDGKAWHSAKPQRFYDLVEHLVPIGRLHEMFSRTRRGGRWTQEGNQLPQPGALPRVAIG